VPADKTIAQVLQENGVDVPLSCEMGICGACLTPVIDGVVDHRDSVQSEAEKARRTSRWRCAVRGAIPGSW
jgi:vanillate O-demethylase ferredoxin subunit